MDSGHSSPTVFDPARESGRSSPQVSNPGSAPGAPVAFNPVIQQMVPRLPQSYSPSFASGGSTQPVYNAPQIYRDESSPTLSPYQVEAVAPVVREASTPPMSPSDTFRGEDPYDGLQDGYHPRDMEIKLEPEFYTCAFVSPLQLGQKRSHSERVCGECFFTVAMLVVAMMQCLTVFGMSTFLAEKDKGYTDEFQLSTMLFAGGDSTLPLGRANDLCGTFDHISLKHVSGQDSLRMPDGTAFSGTPSMPMFHTYKMPSGSWVFSSQSGDDSYVDKLLRVLHSPQWGSVEEAEAFLHFRVDYGVLFVVMVAILWYHILFEFRKTTRFMFMLAHLKAKGLRSGRTGTTKFDAREGVLAIEHLNRNAFIVGCLCVTMRFAVAIMMLTWGTSLLAASWNKLNLVLNALAIGIVFELDVIIAYAVVDHNTISRIESIEPITIRMPSWTCSDSRKAMNDYDIGFSLVMFLGVIIGAMCVRYHQVSSNSLALHNAAALCLFAGPTPNAQPDVLAPVPGFCESLLSLTCGPNVEGPGSYHGSCLVTDQNIFKDRSLMLYVDSGLFENMYDDGKRRSMLEWGSPRKDLTSSRTWSVDGHLDLFRKVCLQLYQPAGTVDMRVVDPSIGLSMYSAPFYCSREKLFQAVFGKAAGSFDKWSGSFDLQDADIVDALDNCRMPATVETKVDDVEPPEDLMDTIVEREQGKRPREKGEQPQEHSEPQSLDPSAVDEHPLPSPASAVVFPRKALRHKAHEASVRTDAEQDSKGSVRDVGTALHRTSHKVRHIVHHRRHREVSQRSMKGGT